MALLNKLAQGSSLSKYNGATPSKSSGIVPLKTKSLAQSELDLDGKSPKKYLDNPPK